MSKIDVNSICVKRFLEDSRSMNKASMSIREGESAIASLIKNIDLEKQNIDRLLQGTKENKSQTASTLLQIKNKILSGTP